MVHSVYSYSPIHVPGTMYTILQKSSYNLFRYIYSLMQKSPKPLFQQLKLKAVRSVKVCGSLANLNQSQSGKLWSIIHGLMVMITRMCTQQDERSAAVACVTAPACPRYRVTQWPCFIKFRHPISSPSPALRRERARELLCSAANRLIGEVVQSLRRPLLGHSPG